MSIIAVRKWGSLYVLNLVMAGLLLVDMRAGLAASLQRLIAAVIVLLFAVLNLAWVEMHTDLMEQEGVDAAADKDLCSSAPYLLYVAGRDTPLVGTIAPGGQAEHRQPLPLTGSWPAPSKSLSP